MHAREPSPQQSARHAQSPHPSGARATHQSPHPSEARAPHARSEKKAPFQRNGAFGTNQCAFCLIPHGYSRENGSTPAAVL